MSNKLSGLENDFYAKKKSIFHKTKSKLTSNSSFQSFKNISDEEPPKRKQ
jgi:hypothetical protein